MFSPTNGEIFVDRIKNERCAECIHIFFSDMAAIFGFFHADSCRRIILHENYSGTFYNLMDIIISFHNIVTHFYITTENIKKKNEFTRR